MADAEGVASPFARRCLVITGHPQVLLDQLVIGMKTRTPNSSWPWRQFICHSQYPSSS